MSTGIVVRAIASRALVAACGLAMPLAHAQDVRDPALAAALEAKQEAEVDRLATARLEADPADTDAWSALVRVARGTSDATTKAALRKRIEACVAAHPRVAACQFGVGVLAFQDSGTMGLAMRGGRIRESLGKAIELDPTLFPARAALVQFHLDAGRLAGGSIDKAREIAAAAA